MTAEALPILRRYLEIATKPPGAERHLRRLWRIWRLDRTCLARARCAEGAHGDLRATISE